MPAYAAAEFGVPGTGRQVEIAPDQNAGRFLVSVRSGTSDEILELYLVDTGGNAARLEGLSGLHHVEWLPRGDSFLGWRRDRPGTSSGLAFVPTRDGAAILSPHMGGVSIEKRQHRSPREGGRLIFGHSPASGGGAFVGVYDAVSRELQLRGPVASVESFEWTEDPDRVIVGQQLLNLQTGQLTPAPPRQQTPFALPDRELPSPDGRFKAVLAWPRDANACGHELSVVVLATGLKQTLRDCHTEGQLLLWVSDRHLIVQVGGCGPCDGRGKNLAIVNVEEGVLRSLTGGLNREGAFAVASPAGNRALIVADRSLQVFDLQANLIRDFGPPPEGFEFFNAAWSPDGTSIAFTLGPANWRGI